MEVSLVVPSDASFCKSCASAFVFVCAWLSCSLNSVSLLGDVVLLLC